MDISLRIARSLRRFVLTTGLAILATNLPSTSLAQTGGTGSIEGAVVDSTGSVVPSATVIATNTLTGVKTTVVTTKAGYFAIPLLNPGPYSVTVNANGFQTYTQEHVVVDALATEAVNPKLTVGAAAQTIIVTSQPPLLQTEDANLGSNLENDTYDALPLAMNASARDPSAFAGLAVGVEGYSVQAAGPSTGSFNGGQTYENETYIEGLPLTSPGYGGGDTRSLAFGISVEAVEQFQVSTAGTQAAYEGQGMANYVVKSGTDKYHGGIYEYFRNTIFDAKPFLTPTLPTPVEHQNEFGGFVGGPVPLFHHKLFFFANYDGYRYDSVIGPAYQDVPTLAEQGKGTAFPGAADFSAYSTATGYNIYDPLTCLTWNSSGTCTGRQQFSYLGTPNVIPPSRLSTVSKSFESYLPVPTNGNPFNNYLALVPNLVNNDNGILKVDYDASSKNRIWGLFSRGRYANPVVGSLAAPSQFSNSALPAPYTDGRTVLEIATTVQVHDAYTIKANMVNDIAWGQSRLFIPLVSNTYGGNYPGKAGLTGLPAGVASSGFPDITFSGTNAVDYPVSWDGTNSHAYNETPNTFDVQDNLLWTKGKHQLTIGGQWQAVEDNENNPLTGSQAGFTFAAQETQNFSSTSPGTLLTGTGAPYASYMLGMVDSASVTQNSVAETGMRWKTISPYIQDNIKVSPRLTVNAGLRWDYWTPGTEVHNRMSFFNPALANPAAGNAPGALEFTGRGIDSCGCRTPIASHYHNWGPRIGFAYSVDNKTVIRGSYGLYYAHAGAVDGHNSNSRQGISQIGFDNTGALSSVATGQGALYTAPAVGTNPTGPVNSSGAVIDGSWDNGYPGNPTAPPFINPGYGTGNIVSPGAIGSASNPMGLGPSSAQTLVWPDPKTGAQPPQYQNWSLNVQRSLSPSTTMSLAYAGTVGHYLPGAGVAGPFTNQIPLQYLPLGPILNDTLVSNAGVENPAYLAAVQAVFPGLLSTLPFPNFAGTVAQALKPYPQYTSLSDPYQDVGNSEYQALQVSFNRRMTSGLTFMANYTFSKELDDLAGVRVPGEDNLEWSVGGVDEKHVFAGTFVYQLPFGTDHGWRSGNTVVDSAIGGWQFSGIVQEHSGAPMTVTGSCTGYSIIDASCYPNATPIGSTGSLGTTVAWNGGSPWQNGKPTTAAAAGSTHYLNAAAFVNATPGTYGDVARTAPDNLFSPRYGDVDLSVRKTVALRESLKLVIQADSFNVSNSVYLSAPSTTVPATPAAGAAPPSTSFGTYSSQANLPRKWQFSARLTF
jgi:hypothetical protein